MVAAAEMQDTAENTGQQKNGTGIRSLVLYTPVLSNGPVVGTGTGRPKAFYSSEIYMKFFTVRCKGELQPLVYLSRRDQLYCICIMMIFLNYT